MTCLSLEKTRLTSQLGGSSGAPEPRASHAASRDFSNEQCTTPDMGFSPLSSAPSCHHDTQSNDQGRAAPDLELFVVGGVFPSFPGDLQTL